MLKYYENYDTKSRPKITRRKTNEISEKELRTNNDKTDPFSISSFFVRFRAPTDPPYARTRLHLEPIL